MKARSVEGSGRINIRQMVPVMGTMKSQDFPKEEETYPLSMPSTNAGIHQPLFLLLW